MYVARDGISGCVGEIDGLDGLGFGGGEEVTFDVGSLLMHYIERGSFFFLFFFG